MAVYAGRWDCNTCGHIGNHGPNKHCINCGSPRPKNVKFYLPDNAQALIDEEAIKEALVGPDWVCKYCETPNVAYAKFCSECGASQSGEFLKEKTYTNEEVPLDSGKETQADHVAQYKEKHGLTKKVKRFFSWAKATALALVTAIVAWLSSFSSTVNVEIVALNWERTIEIQEYKLVEEEDWHLPTSGKLIESFRAVHHYDKVSKGFETKTKTIQVQVGTETYACGKKDLGNGYFEDVYCDRPIYEDRQETYREEVFEDVPVYQTKYRYSIKRWKPESSLTDKGTSKPAIWPTSPKLENTGRYRIGDRKERYSIVIKRKNKTHTEEVNPSFWENQEVGQKVKAEISTVFRYYKGLVKE
ncbi:MAG: Ran-binding zinc finger domain-containing protein [Bacteroidota bacterium]